MAGKARRVRGAFAPSMRLTRRKFLDLFFPTVLMTAANNLCLFADSLVTSRLCGPDRLSAIQLLNPVIALMQLSYWMIGIGGSLICFEEKTAHRTSEGDGVFTVSVGALVLSGGGIGAVCFFFAAPIARLLCTDPHLAAYAAEYLSVMAFAFPLLSFLMGMAYFLRADGRPGIPFAALIVFNLVNLFLDVVFVRYCGMDVRGAALASVAGYLAGSLVTCLYFVRPGRTLFFDFRAANVKKMLPGILKRGFPAASSQLYAVVRGACVNLSIGAFSPAALLAVGVFNGTQFVPYLIFIGFAQTMSPIASFYHQKGDRDTVKRVGRAALTLSFLCTLALTLTVFFRPGLLTGAFGITEQADIATVRHAFSVLPWSYLGTGLVFVLIFYLQAIRELKLSGVLSLLDGLVFPVAGTLGLGALLGAQGVFLALVLAPLGALCVYLAAVMFRKRGLLLTGDDTRALPAKFTFAPSRLSDEGVRGDLARALQAAGAPSRLAHDTLRLATGVGAAAPAGDTADLLFFTEKERCGISLHFLGKHPIDCPIAADYARVIGIDTFTLYAPREASVSIGAPDLDDARSLAALIRAEYGEHYSEGVFYEPEKYLKEVNGKGAFALCARTETGELAAHVRVSAWGMLPGIHELGALIVAKDRRGKHLAARLSEAAIDEARRRGCRTLLICADTRHTASQKIFSALGAGVGGFSLNCLSPESESSFTRFHERTGMCMQFLPLTDAPRTSFVPALLSSAAEKICSDCGFQRTVKPDDGAVPTENASRYATLELPSMQMADLYFYTLGTDAPEILADAVRGYQARGVEAAHLFLPLDRPGAAWLYGIAEEAGYFFTGLFPGGEERDYLYLTRLTSPVAYEHMQCIPKGAEVLKTIRDFSLGKS